VTKDKMPNEELKQYIEKSRQAGKTDDQIRQELLSAGWQINLIDEALALFNIPAVVNGSVVKSIMDRREKISLIVLVISVPLVFIFSEKIPKLMALPVISGFTSFINV
jgi:hypothetical protein